MSRSKLDENGRHLTPMKIVYASFDEVPSYKAASTHILANCRKPMLRHRLILLSLGEVVLPPSAGFIHIPAAIREKNYLRRGEFFRAFVQQQLLAEQPDVFHFRTPWEGLLAGRLGLPNVYEVNGLPSIELPYHYRDIGARPLAILRQWEQACLEKADAIVCPSERIRQCLLSRYAIADAGRITVIPNGYDRVPMFEPGEDALPLKAVYLGTLNVWQGILWALKGFAALRGQFSLDIYGVGAPKVLQQAEKRILRYGLQDQVRMHGPLDRASLNHRLGQYQVGLAPLLKTERNAAQGCCPVKIMDYLNHGLITVAPDLAVVRAMVGDRYNGLLFRPNCLTSFVSTLQELAERSAELPQWRHNARLSLERFPTWDECSGRMLAIYEQIT
ncbi:MAG: glycosyltransferase family 4 protein [Methylococcaceae bacterium]|nr:glycosyltransferase family 4 protein [Methylococcaceae bacterium]